MADKSLIKELVNSEKEKIVRIFDKNKLKKISFSPDSKIERKENNEYLKPQSDTKIHKIEMNLEKINNEPPPPNHRYIFLLLIVHLNRWLMIVIIQNLYMIRLCFF